MNYKNEPVQGQQLRVKAKREIECARDGGIYHTCALAWLLDVRPGPTNPISRPCECVGNPTQTGTPNGEKNAIFPWLK